MSSDDEEQLYEVRQLQGVRELSLADDNFVKYCEHLGLKSDDDKARFLDIARKAYDAPLAPGWDEFEDAEGRVYFHSSLHDKSSWLSPTDEMFREIIDALRTAPAAAEARLATLVAHLRDVHARASMHVKQFAGPYVDDAVAAGGGVETGDGGASSRTTQVPYYFNRITNASTWANPLAYWRFELESRYAILGQALGLTPEVLASLDAGQFRLTVDEARGAAETPSTTRSFHTARSQCSARRSGRIDGPSLFESARAEPAGSPAGSPGRPADEVESGHEQRRWEHGV